MRVMGGMSMVIGLCLVGLVQGLIRARQADSPAPWLAYISYHDPAADTHINLLNPFTHQESELETPIPLYTSRPPRWSPDGTWLAFNGANDEIYLIHVSGNFWRRLTVSPEVENEPFWSPSGEWLAFVAYDNTTDESNLYRIRRNGQQYDKLPSTYQEHYNPAWTPDSASLTYAVSDGDGTLNILQLNLNQKTLTPLIEDEERKLGVAWSPAGDYFLYAQLFTDENNQTRRVLIRYDRRDNTVLPLTPTIVQAVHASWSPDGEWIVFTGTVEGNDDIYKVRADGRDLQRLTDHPRVDNQPAWSTDGEWIAFVSLRDGNSEIYLIGADGHDLRRLTHNTSRSDVSPSWSSFQEQTANFNLWRRIGVGLIGFGLISALWRWLRLPKRPIETGHALSRGNRMTVKNR